MTGILVFIGVIIYLLAVLAFSFFCTAGVIWLICWAFTLAFSWKVVFGIWLVMCLLRTIFSSSVTVKRD